mgnify:CR=1 FL=1
MLRYIFVCFFTFTFLFNCSSSQNKKAYNLENNLISPEEIYFNSMQLFNDDNLVLANEEFKKLIKLFPLSNEAIQAEIMIGFIKLWSHVLVE